MIPALCRAISLIETPKKLVCSLVTLVMILKIGLKMFKALYEGTPWYDAYVEKMNTIQNTTNPW